MALDRLKLIETAQRHVEKRQYNKAIALLRRVVGADPSDTRTWLRLGDVYTRAQQLPEACDAYLRVAQTYTQDGFLLKAIAVYRQVARLDPTRLDVLTCIAELYEQLDLVYEAVDAFEQLAGAYELQGDMNSALSVLHHACELDPDSVPGCIRYAEALSRAGRPSDAAEAFRVAAEILRERNRLDDYTKVAERLLYHKPTDAPAAFELAQVYLQRDDPRRALAKLQICFKAEPRNLITLETLADVFIRLKQPGKAISVLKEVARIHADNANAEQRARVFKRITELDPADPDARQALAALAKSNEAPPPPVRRRTSSRLPAAASSGGASAIQEEPQPDAEPVTAPGGVSIPPDVAREAQLARHLTEAEVFMRYALLDKALVQLEAAVKLDSTHIGAREQLREALLQQERFLEAAHHTEVLAKLLRPHDPAAHERYLNDAEMLREQARAQDDSRSGATQAAGKRRHANNAHSVDDADILEVNADEYEEVQASDSGVHQLQNDVPVGNRSPQIRSAVGVQGARKHEASGTSRVLHDDSGAVRSLARASREQTWEDAETSEDATASLPNVGDVLEAAEFYSAQGLYDEGLAVIDEALTAHPDNPLLSERRAALETMRRTLEGMPSFSPPPNPDEQLHRIEADLVEELDDSMEHEGADMIDVATVLDQFKRGIEQQIAVDDSETHFDLAIAYKEMGLVIEAMHEFRTAMRNPSRECLSRTMLGLCHLELGQPNEAIQELRQGLHSPLKTQEQELAIYFELGGAYAALNDTNEALYYFQKVHRQVPGYRNVEQRIQALRNRPSTLQSAPPVPRI